MYFFLKSDCLVPTTSQQRKNGRSEILGKIWLDQFFVFINHHNRFPQAWHCFQQLSLELIAVKTRCSIHQEYNLSHCSILHVFCYFDISQSKISKKMN